MNAPIAEIPRLVRQLYEVVGEFERLFEDKNRKFTPDGHLVGSIGEVLAAYMYQLTLHVGSHPLHDAVSQDKRQVQIKATQGKNVGLGGQPEHLIVIQIDKEGHPKEIYNGPGQYAWNACWAMQSNGQRFISVAKLKNLMKLDEISQHKLPQIRQT